MDKIDYRKADIEKLIESSSSEFGKEMYNNHISLMNRVYRKVNNSLENVQTDFRMSVIEKYMKWFNEWYTDVNNQELDIICFILGDSLRNVTDYFNSIGYLVMEQLGRVAQMVEEKSKEYEY